MPRFAKKVDGNQREIVSYLRKQSGQVLITNMGDDFPDLLCGTYDGWVLLEVKKPDGCLDRGQLKFLRDARGPVAVVTTEDEAFNAVWGDATITSDEQTQIARWLIRNPSQETLSVKKFRQMISGEKLLNGASGGTQRKKNWSPKLGEIIS